MMNRRREQWIEGQKKIKLEGACMWALNCRTIHKPQSFQEQPPLHVGIAVHGVGRGDELEKLALFPGHSCFVCVYYIRTKRERDQKFNHVLHVLNTRKTGKAWERGYRGVMNRRRE